jgi:NADPH:quinone reductase-like Zn-dependent oxidoreductase
VSDSRSLRFVEDVRAATDGAGVDVILNTLAGEAVPANLSLLRPYGRYVELSKRDVVENTPLGMGALARNISFHVVDVVHTIRSEPERAGAVLRTVLDLVARKVLRPLPYREFPVDQAAEAFRLMSRSQQVGKILLAFPAQLPAPVTPARQAPDGRLTADGTYLVTGGLGGICAEVGRWLAAHGARHLLLTGRSPVPDPAPLAELRASGVEVEYVAVDVADEPAMRAVLDARHAAGYPDVVGVLHAAELTGRSQEWCGARPGRGGAAGGRPTARCGPAAGAGS